MLVFESLPKILLSNAATVVAKVFNKPASSHASAVLRTFALPVGCVSRSFTGVINADSIEAFASPSVLGESEAYAHSSSGGGRFSGR